MLKNNLKITTYAIIVSILNFFLFHFPFFKFVIENVDYSTNNGIAIIVSLVILMLLLNTFVFYLLVNVFRKAGRYILVLFFVINSIAIYFVNTYSVIIDGSMIGNILNTNYEESSSFFSWKLVLYFLILGVLPSIFVMNQSLVLESNKKILKKTGIVFLITFIFVFANASNWLWIDKNSKKLGGLAMPWSYTVNTIIFFKQKYEKNQKEIPLPNATVKNSSKAVMVLVIGESSRSQNFSLYGYRKNTNPLLSKTENLTHYNATSCATYTTAGLKCILEHKNTSDLYEILPNYLYRNNVDVIWRTTNWGEPPIHIKKYETKEDLKVKYKNADPNYDEILLSNLTDEIKKSKSNKILIILHTNTSHGPTYSKKYPKEFEKFSPVCNSVELGKCTQTELMNAYDNTIVYTDYLLHKTIEDLKSLKDYKSSLIFVSDHGESLGEKNLYMHGVPMSIAPKEQYEIPFIVWVSDNQQKLKPFSSVTQNSVFHSVLKFLDVQSPIYQEDLNIYK